jgi:predicted O-linked N-acetylglucosamine transferase (SPINDLY family)
MTVLPVHDLSTPLAAALTLHRAGKLVPAARAYDAILSLDPNHQEAVYLRALTQLQRQEHAQAVQGIRRAMELGPARPAMYFNLGHALRALGDAAGAVASYRSALALGPGDDNTRWCLINTLREQGQHAQALADLEAAGPLAEGSALWTLRSMVWEERARALGERGEHDEALALLLRRAEHEPASAQARFALAEQLERMGLSRAAVSAYQAALRIDDRLAHAHNNLSCLWLALRDPERALEHAVKASQCEPAMAAAHNNLGLALLQVGRPAEAARSIERSIELEPGLVQTWVNAASAWRDSGDVARAARACERAQELDPAFEFLPGHLVALRMELCDWRGFDALVTTLPGRLARSERVILPLELLSVLDDPACQLQAARVYGVSHLPPHPGLGPLPARTGAGRIRLGYLSADFRSHPVAALMAGVIEQHDRGRFEVIGLSLREAPDDPVQQVLKQRFDRFENLQGRPARDIALWCRKQGLDILVDLGGYTDGNLPEVMAWRAAPVQVNFLGYPGTLGLPNVDYIVVDDIVVPPDSRRHYSERALVLPRVFQPHDDRRERPEAPGTRADWGLPPDAVVFCCFNKSSKITPHVWESWMRILEQVPGSVLWLTTMQDEVAANLGRALRARGIDIGRVLMARRQPYPVYLGLYAHADLFLDTWPFNAGTIACDALWMGLPVLTCSGRSFAARMATSLLRELGLDELVCDSPAAYEERAVSLAHDRARLHALKSLLPERREGSIMNDTRRWTRQFEAGLEEMADRSRRGLAPADIVVTTRSAPDAGN